MNRISSIAIALFIVFGFFGVASAQEDAPLSEWLSSELERLSAGAVRDASYTYTEEKNHAVIDSGNGTVYTLVFNRAWEGNDVPDDGVFMVTMRTSQDAATTVSVARGSHEVRSVFAGEWRDLVGRPRSGNSE